MNEPEVVVLADPAAGAVEAAARIAASLASAVEGRGRADWATTGGSTPVAIYRRLVAPPLLEAVPWAAVHAWWGDDRFVPRDHPLSNVKSFDDILLGIGDREEGTSAGGSEAIPIPLDNVHPFRAGEAIGAGRGADRCAAEYAAELGSAGLAMRDGWPVFDLMLIGIGADGHLLSVFPGSAAFASRELALAIAAPTHIEPHVERVTLNPGVVGAATQVIVVVNGADKAAVVARILGGERDPERWPAQLARRAGATWILDEAAAATLAG